VSRIGLEVADDIVEAKRALRRQMDAMRSEVGESDRRAAAEATARALLRRLGGRRTARWAIYAALRNELSMKPLFDGIRALGQLPLLPRIHGGDLEFVPVRDWSDLRRGPLGVLEPPRGHCGQPLQPGDIVVVPGLAFDRAGNRLGRGRGFYDRAFGTARSTPLLIGAGYAFQVRAHVPHTSRDRRVDAIVTEGGMIWPRGPR
jgi:5-formyltetrahydrofolate cyclo-ligase